MKLKTILSTTLAAVMLGTSVTPVLAQGRGNKYGHDKNGKSSGQHQSQQRGRDNDDRWRRDQNRDRDRDRDRNWDRDRQRQSEWERERARREAEERRRRESERWRNDQYRNRNDWDRREYDRRQDTKNEWRNIAIASGAVAVLGLLQKDNTLVFAGSAGALYSLYRYEQDRKSQNSLNRARASYFDRDYFYRDGRRYDRQIVNRNGQRYYQFVCR